MTETAEERWGKSWSNGAPPPGSFGLSRIGGLLGKLIAAGQAFSGDGSRWTHAFIVLEGGWVLEAMPGGARIVSIGERLRDSEVVFCDAPVQQWLQANSSAYGPDTEYLKRRQVSQVAYSLDRVGYGYLQYLALGLVELGFRPKWLRRYIASRGRMICSQLVDEVYRRAGIQVFDDGRLPQDVTPGDLAIRYGIG